MPQTAGQGRPFEWEENDRRGTQAHPCHVYLAEQYVPRFLLDATVGYIQYWTKRREMGCQHSRAANSRVQLLWAAVSDIRPKDQYCHSHAELLCLQVP